MDVWRRLRLLLLALPFALGLAEGAAHEPRAPAEPVVSSAPAIGAPTQSLPRPVHDEATCAFCQAAIFPPCAPAPAAFVADLLDTVRHEVVAADARIPHLASLRPASSRAPPALRSA
jgi:hypothetical protein